MMDDVMTVTGFDPYRLLAYKIVERAIYDWRGIVRGEKESARKNRIEIEQFLLGRWCSVLLSFTDAVDGYWVWDNLLHEQHKKRETRTATVNGRTMSLYAWGKKLGLNLGALNGYYKAHGKEETEEKIAEMVRRAKSNGRAVVSR